MPTKAELVDMLANQQASEAAMQTVVNVATGNQSAMIAIGTGMIALAACGYMWYRKVSADRREDSTFKVALEESARAMQTWREMAEGANKRADEAHKRADDIRAESMATIERLAIERNEAVQTSGKLTATVENLQLTVENQTSMIQQLKKENKDLTETLENQGDMLRSVLEQLARVSAKLDDMEDDKESA
jgi:hypothetical protein